MIGAHRYRWRGRVASVAAAIAGGCLVVPHVDDPSQTFLCRTNDDCVKGYGCVDGRCRQQGAALGDDRGSGSDPDAADTDACGDARCTPCSIAAPCEDGGVCLANAECAHTCVGGVCAPSGAAGARCDADDGDDCQSGRCLGTMCAAPMDPCADGDNGGCDANAWCSSTGGQVTCTCWGGYAGDGITCSDADECALGTDDCDVNADCANTVGSFGCRCKAGFSGDGLTCADIDECAVGRVSPCALHATCSNTPLGSFTCTCDAGYSGDGTVSCCDNRMGTWDRTEPPAGVNVRTTVSSDYQYRYWWCTLGGDPSCTNGYGTFGAYYWLYLQKSAADVLPYCNAAPSCTDQSGIATQTCPAPCYDPTAQWTVSCDSVRACRFDCAGSCLAYSWGADATCAGHP